MAVRQNCYTISTEWFVKSGCVHTFHLNWLKVERTNRFRFAREIYEKQVLRLCWLKFVKPENNTAFPVPWTQRPPRHIYIHPFRWWSLCIFFYSIPSRSMQHCETINYAAEVVSVMLGVCVCVCVSVSVLPSSSLSRFACQLNAVSWCTTRGPWFIY